MSRKSELAYQTENNPFSTRLREIMEECKTTQKQLADAIGKRPQTVSLYMNGQSLPDALTLREIGKYFGVSTDWLLDREGAAKSTDANITIACKYTGLSEDAVIALHEDCSQPMAILPIMQRQREILSEFIEALVERMASDFLPKAIDAIDHYEKATFEIDSAKNDDIKDILIAQQKAEEEFKEYQVAAFWCQQSVMNWLVYMATRNKDKTYEQMQSEVDSRVKKLILKNCDKQVGETNGQYSETDK